VRVNKCFIQGAHNNSQSIRWLVWAGNCLSCQRGRKPFWEAADGGGRRLCSTIVVRVAADSIEKSVVALRQLLTEVR